jgi:hypothetical protein
MPVICGSLAAAAVVIEHLRILQLQILRDISTPSENYDQLAPTGAAKILEFENPPSNP